MGKSRIPDTPASADRLAWLEARSAQVLRDIASCRKAKSWQALTAAERQLLVYRNEIDKARAALDAASQATADPSTMTPEEWAERVRQDASAAQDADLEVYVSEWARRMGRVIVAEGDEIRLVRRRTA